MVAQHGVTPGSLVEVVVQRAKASGKVDTLGRRVLMGLGMCSVRRGGAL